MSLTASPALEVKTELDTNLLTGAPLVRVIYRPAGTRCWTRILVVPDADQSVEQIVAKATEIAEAHLAGSAGRS